MATLLDITALEHFKGIFPFLLILVLVYAVLTRTDWFKERKGTAALVAAIVGFMTLFSPIAIKTIDLMAPWFVLFIIFGVLMVLAYMSFGISEKKVVDVITGDTFGNSFGFWVVAIMLMIGLGSLFTVINQEAPLVELGEGGQQPVQADGFWPTLFHPKILGMVVILLVAFFTIGKMASTE